MMKRPACQHLSSGPSLGGGVNQSGRGPLQINWRAIVWTPHSLDTPLNPFLDTSTPFNPIAKSLYKVHEVVGTVDPSQGCQLSWSRDTIKSLLWVPEDEQMRSPLFTGLFLKQTVSESHVSGATRWSEAALWKGFLCSSQSSRTCAKINSAMLRRGMPQEFPTPVLKMVVVLQVCRYSLSKSLVFMAVPL